jgi:ADP-ribose pyrophosphatase YjhB (NUDIX family)
MEQAVLRKVAEETGLLTDSVPLPLQCYQMR